MQWLASKRREHGRRGAYNAALTLLHTGRGAPMAAIDQALREHADFVSGYCLRAALLVMA